jgi:hypothetical protein
MQLHFSYSPAWFPALARLILSWIMSKFLARVLYDSSAKSSSNRKGLEITLVYSHKRIQEWGEAIQDSLLLVENTFICSNSCADCYSRIDVLLYCRARFILNLSSLYSSSTVTSSYNVLCYIHQPNENTNNGWHIEDPRAILCATQAAFKGYAQLSEHSKIGLLEGTVPTTTLLRSARRKNDYIYPFNNILKFLPIGLAAIMDLWEWTPVDSNISKGKMLCVNPTYWVISPFKVIFRLQ